MNSTLASQPSVAPHLLQTIRLSPSHSGSNQMNLELNRRLTPLASNTLGSTMSGRKRKAEDDSQDDRMSSSPSSSPAVSSKSLNQSTSPRSVKKARTNIHGRPLSLPRLLETLGIDDLRNLLQSVCERRPELGAEVIAAAPRPSVCAAVDVLRSYESTLHNSFPFGNKHSSDYAYNRVQKPLHSLLTALRDYTPHFLPPNEPQTTTSLSFLDEATTIISRLPDWDTFQNNRHKQDAFEEISKAWALVIREASKKGGGIQLQHGSWDQKLARYNEISGGKMEQAMTELRSSLGWMGSMNDYNTGGPLTNEYSSIREQPLSGTFNASFPVRVGPWRAP